MLPTREISRRFGRQEWSSRPYTTGKIPHVVADWLAHVGDMGQPRPHSSTSHWISSLHFSELWTRCVCNLERQQLLLQVTYMVGVRCSERQTGVPNCACGFLISLEDYNLFLQVSVCSWFPPLHYLEMACLDEFNSGLPISKSRDHSLSETSAAPSVIPRWWMFSAPPATPTKSLISPTSPIIV